MTSEVRKVLFLLPTLQGGGSERVVVNLLRHLDRKRYCATLAVVDTRVAAYRDQVPADVECVDLGCSRVRYALPGIISLIRRRRPDIVLSTLGHLNLALAIIRRWLPDGVAYVARESSIVSESVRQYGLSPLWRWAYRHHYGAFDRVVCQSHYMRDDLVTAYRLSVGKTVVIPNPVELTRIRALAFEPLDTGMGRASAAESPRSIHLVAAGRLVDVKGFDLLIKALALHADPRVHLTVLGEGPLRQTLQRLAQEVGVADRVRFPGFQANPYPFFAQADAFVLSSHHEGLPNVVLEALACGTPVVATPALGGTAEILEGLEGCHLAGEITAASLADAFARLTPGRRMSAACVQAYEAEAVTRRYEEVFEEARRSRAAAE